MSKHRFELELEIDDEALEKHVDKTGGNEYPLVAEPDEFRWIDLEAAIEKGFVLDEVEISNYTFVE